jgi:hypothetical protein
MQGVPLRDSPGRYRRPQHVLLSDVPEVKARGSRREVQGFFLCVSVLVPRT